MPLLDTTLLGPGGIKAMTWSGFDVDSYDTVKLFKRVEGAKVVSLLASRKIQQLVTNGLPLEETPKVESIMGAVFGEEWRGQLDNIRRVLTLTSQFLSSRELVVKDARAKLLTDAISQVLGRAMALKTGKPTPDDEEAQKRLDLKSALAGAASQSTAGNDDVKDLLAQAVTHCNDRFKFMNSKDRNVFFNRNALMKELVSKAIQGQNLREKGYVGLKKPVRLEIGREESKAWAKGRGGADLDDASKKTTVYFDFSDTTDSLPLWTSHTVIHEATHKAGHTKDHWYGGVSQGAVHQAAENADSIAFAALSLAYISKLTTAFLAKDDVIKFGLGAK